MDNVFLVNFQYTLDLKSMFQDIFKSHKTELEYMKQGVLVHQGSFLPQIFLMVYLQRRL